MASFADALELFKGTELFKIIIPFILVYVIAYAVLRRVKFIESKELQAAIAFILAMGVVLSPTARTFITSIVPPLTSFAIVIFLLILVLFSSGFRVEDLTELMQVAGKPLPERSIIWAVLIGIGIVLIVAAVAGAFPDAIASNMDAIKQNATAMNMTVNEYINTLPVGKRVMFFISLPQVIGLIMLTLIFVFAGAFLIP